MDLVQILNITVHNLSREELLSRLHPNAGGVVVTPNIDHLIKLQSDEEFYSLYQSADYRVCDSQLLFYFSRWLGAPIREKISGADLLPSFYRYYKGDQRVKLFLLGGEPGTPETAKARINEKVGYPMVVDAYSPPYGFEQDAAECEAIIEKVNRSGANVLAVGLGAPKQEKWIFKHRDRLTNVSTFLAVGAAIAFEAGTVKRAPAWMSEAGLEWFYRVLMEPRRLWKRYFVDSLPFFTLIYQQRMNRYKNPFAKNTMPKAHSLPQT